MDAKNSSSLDEKSEHKNTIREDENMIIHEGKRNMTLQSDATATALISSPDQIIGPCPPLSILNSCMIYSFAIRGNVKSVEDRSKIAKNEAKMKPLLRLDPGLKLLRMGAGPVLESTNAADKVKELKDESAFVKPEDDAVENSKGVFSELSSQIDNVLPMHSDSKDVNLCVETSESPRKSDCNRLLKYTFQRKRKKGSLSSFDGNTSPDNSNIKRRAVEKHSDAAKPQKSSLINESSRDSQRLAQVAR